MCTEPFPGDQGHVNTSQTSRLASFTCVVYARVKKERPLCVYVIAPAYRKQLEDQCLAQVLL
jgi:hypothetical protein